MIAITNRREVEIDTRIADLYARLSESLTYERRAIDTMHGAHRDSLSWSKPRRWNRSDEDVIEFVPSEQRRAQMHADALATLKNWRNRIAELRNEISDLAKQYTGWSRFFLVTSSDGGHIHSSMHCSTCYVSTVYGWLPQLSGLTERDAVEDQGPRLCSVCFPSAPVEWTQGTPKVEKTYCTGSGKHSTQNSARLYVQCPDCGKSVARTKYGEIRKHVA